MSEPLIGAAQAPATVIKDANTQSFRADVLEASMEAPVVVDFWAPWCGPCKTLGPMLERAVKATRGKVRMVKINVDENQQLAAQLRIQSIPAVFAFHQGRPVDAFAGALPEQQVKSFVDKLAKLAGNGSGDEDLQEALKEAADALAAGDAETAGGIYSQILQVAPELPAAIAGLARALVALGRTADASRVLDQAPPEAAKAPEVISVKRSIELAGQTAGQIGQIPGLRQRIAADPADHQARFDLAMALYGAGKAAEAVDELLEIVRRDREWNGQAARTQLVKLFEALGPTDRLTLSARRRLSSLLFS